MHKVKLYLVNLYKNIKDYLYNLYMMPKNIDDINKHLNNIDRNINELKEIDFITIGR